MAYPSNSGANHFAPRRLIVAPPVGETGVGFGKFLAVWLASTFINGAILGLGFIVFLILGSVSASAPLDVQPEMRPTTEMEDKEKEPDLTNDTLGLDPDVPPGFNVDRIEEVVVPGRVDPTAAPGILNAAEAPPRDVPPPPGTGSGTGGALFDPTKSGGGALTGALGGYGGLYNAGGFGGRSGSTRQKMLTEGGGNELSEAAVAAGLEFLALHQCPDGRWSLHEFHRYARTAPLPAGTIRPDNSQPMTTRRNDVAGTAFGLLPFLAAGITHKPSKEAKVKDYTKGVGLAIKWLIAKQSKTGNDRGYYGGDMYSHALASIAMCEAYALTSDPMIKASAQLALNYIVAAQDPAGGGWRYSARAAGDTSVTGWMLMALKSGQMAGLSVPRHTLQRVEKYLNSCESSGGGGGYGYMAGTSETPTMTAVGALCRQYLGASPRNRSLLESVRRIKGIPPGKGNLYYEYYATQVMHHMGGDAWKYWNLGPDGTGKGGIRDTLIAKQDQGLGGRPGQKGSFPGGEHVGGRLGGTSLSLLSLEVYYRHLPLYRRDVGTMKKD